MSFENRHKMHKFSADNTFEPNDRYVLEDACILADSSSNTVDLVLPRMYEAEDGFRLRVRRSGAGNNVTVTADANNKMDLGALGASDTLGTDGDTGLYVFQWSENSWVKFG